MIEIGYLSQSSWKQEAFLRRLAMHLTGSKDFRYSEIEAVWYLGGGYWRAALSLPSCRLWTLINPSLADDQIAVVTEAMKVLINGEHSSLVPKGGDHEDETVRR